VTTAVTLRGSRDEQQEEPAVTVTS
jgi:hypothetical protein